jgi:hypothetical protein
LQDRAHIVAVGVVIGGVDVVVAGHVVILHSDDIATIGKKAERLDQPNRLFWKDLLAAWSLIRNLSLLAEIRDLQKEWGLAS